VGLSGKADRPVKGFSGGEKQRLGIAQAAINDPELIILDEPASALDPLGRRDVLKILESFRGRSTVFYSTHILDDVQRVSDRVVILERGRLIAQGRIEELLSGNRDVFNLTVRGDGSAVLAKLLAVLWVTKVEVDRGIPNLENVRTTKLEIHVTDVHAAETELLRLAISNPDTIVTQFDRSTQNLEDIFVNLVEGSCQK
jgi:ABC-2 type transport system ATP-binding protein